MKLHHPILAALIATLLAAFSLATLAAPASAAAPTPTQSLPGAIKPPVPKPQVKPVPDKKPQDGKTRGLKSKKGKECITDAGCESGNRK